jgi:hypothetical protein
VTEEELLLVECFKHIQDVIKGRGGKKGIKKSILRYVSQLYHQYGITRDDIAANLFYTFWKRKRHIKYDAKLGTSLESYVAWFAYYQLLTIIEQCRQYLQKRRTVPLADHYVGDRISRSGMSIEPFEREGFEELVNPDTPEDMIINKELMEMALNHFGEDDLEVLLGASSREDEAKRLNIDYFAYCKRLSRKKKRFRSHLKKIGYFD